MLFPVVMHPAFFLHTVHKMSNPLFTNIPGKVKQALKYMADKRMQPLADALLFVVLLTGFHFIYLFWSKNGFYPFESQVIELFARASRQLFIQSDYLLHHTGIEYITDNQTFYITNNEGGFSWLEVSPGCTSLKQWLHWIVLMIVFPGPRRHKWWYIPLGVLIIQAISIVRITGLVCAIYQWPGSFSFFHDYIFKLLFYGTIFLMWLLWVECFRYKKTRS